MRRHSALALLTLPSLLLLAGSCDSGASGPTDETPLPGNPRVAVVELSAPPTLLVNEMALLQVTPRDSLGRVIAHPPRPAFSSSDSSVVSVDASGVVRGLRRGSATIVVRVADVTASSSLDVRARLKIRPTPPQGWGSWPLAIGDTLRLSAIYVDVNGVAIVEAPTVSWRSSLPDAAAVTADGWVIGTAPGLAEIHADSPDAADSSAVSVADFGAGQLASIRYAHAMKGVGPLTFVPNKGDPVTLTYGQSVERPIPVGLFMLRMEGMPAGDTAFGRTDYTGLIYGSNRLTVYAMGGSSQGFLSGLWSSTQSVPADSSRVRLVQGWSPYEVIYLRPTGAPADGVPELCYLDPGDASFYFSRTPGDFDLILQPKYGSAATVRISAAASAGGAITLALVGSSADEMGVLTFVDQ